MRPGNNATQVLVPLKLRFPRGLQCQVGTTDGEALKAAVMQRYF